MSTARVRLAPGITYEVLAREVIVHVRTQPHSSASTVVRLGGDSADLFLLAAEGSGGVSADSRYLPDLLDLGLLVTADTPVITRRSVLTAGAVGAGAGIALLALPQAALASSVQDLQGRWGWNSDDQALALFAGVPSAAVDGDDSDTIRPRVSPLAVDGRGDFSYTSFISNYGPVGGPAIRWARDPFGDPGAETVLVGSFTLDSVSYRATFRRLPED